MTEARQKPQPQKKVKKKSWKKEYLRILLNGPASPDDYPIAAELIKKGMADGTYLQNHRAPGTIANLMWRGITLDGRAYAETLEGQLKRSSGLGRLLIGLGSIAGTTVIWFWQEILSHLKHLILGA